MKNCIRYVLMVWFLVFLIIGIFCNKLNCLLVSVLLIWLHNVLFCMNDIKKYFLLLILHMTIFLFLLSCPVISIIKHYEWKVFEIQDLNFSLLSINVSLICLYIGAQFTKLFSKDKKKCDIILVGDFRDCLQVVSLILYSISMPAYLYIELEKVIYMQGRSYADYYVGFVSSAPMYIYVLSSFMRYALCIYLSTMPNKKNAFLPLAFFLLSGIPSLIVGIRNTIMLNALFILIYYFLRDVCEDTTKWIGKIERVVLVIMAPIIIIFMGAYNYIRDGSSIELNIFDLIIDFVYRQGVSFNVLNIGHANLLQLPQKNIGLYTVGGFVDYFLHGNIAQILFGAESLGNGNSVKMGLESHSFAHNLSYIAREGYLEGHGWGSSYLLETYADFGYCGIAIFSIIIGILLVIFINWFQRKDFLSIIMLVCVTKIFYIPRAASTEWLEFVITAQFWLPIIICYFGAALCCKKYNYSYYRKDEANNV